MNCLPSDLQDMIYKMAQKMLMEEVHKELKLHVCVCCDSVHNINDLYHCDQGCNVSFCDQGDNTFVCCPSCNIVFHMDDDLLDDGYIFEEEEEYRESYGYLDDMEVYESYTELF